ncbi:hypothetical protein [Mesorhizobium sp.]|uniref:hypothetical protein n=1 Tax=Mesorhizobium sp. TaxID=1871066 RepID=UPI000FE61F11|nr:MAG: hypothetical protein EOS44_34770 [Mesorhizobium sp.]
MHAKDARQQADEAFERAEEQQIKRLRYQALLAERQYDRVDPDNRLIAAELERRGRGPCVSFVKRRMHLSAVARCKVNLTI